MISIITAVRNLLPMNKLYFESLKKYTRNKFELIIIDNGSTDGSAEYFRNVGAKIISNNGNYSYCYTQNQGIKAASHDILCFFNNDLIVSPGWDEKMLKIMDRENLDIFSFATNDRSESEVATRKIRNRWKAIKNPLLFLFGVNKPVIKVMHKLMYGNWEKYILKRYSKFGDKIKEGVSGSCIVMSREAINKIGIWDERIFSGDFDYLIRSKIRNKEIGDIKPIHILLGVYFHHYSRLTTKAKAHAPYSDISFFTELEDKWGVERIKDLLKDIEY